MGPPHSAQTQARTRPLCARSPLVLALSGLTLKSATGSPIPGGARARSLSSSPVGAVFGGR